MTYGNNGNAKGGDGKPGRRQLFFINPAFQWKYTLTVAVTVFFTTSIISTVLYSVLHDQARMRAMQPHSYVGNVTGVVLLSAIAFSAITAGALGFWCIVATHRICGPAFVLQRYMSQLAAGQIPTFRPLRKKDEFKELYAVCSRAVESLKASKETELMMIGQAREALQKAHDVDESVRRDGLETVSTQLDILEQSANKALGREPEQPDLQPASAAGKAVETAAV